ncbi:MAG: hypothetical protein NC206_01770 [Bacteroides sp.]|nr:hypothetical protein [Roseburia sp.]MCM1345795.1 hypothetical protein [Bacteroides sp.]MCM1420523.1 hypothetical protein [Bacteroides sp.]
MKEDVVAANLANLRQSINELKECIEKQNASVPASEQSVKVNLDEKTIYNGVAKSFCTCWNDALSVVKKHVWKQQPDTLPFSLWFPKLVELFKQKSKLLEYLYTHVCDYNLNRMTIEANTSNILKRQDEILAKVHELKYPITIIPPNINGMFIRGYHIKLRYVVAFIVVLLMWAVVASVSSLKYKEESFAHYSMYRAVKEQHQSFIEKVKVVKKDD